MPLISTHPWIACPEIAIAPGQVVGFVDGRRLEFGGEQQLRKQNEEQKHRTCSVQLGGRWTIIDHDSALGAVDSGIETALRLH